MLGRQEYAMNLNVSRRSGFCTRCEQRVEPLARHIMHKHRQEYAYYTRAGAYYLLALEVASTEPKEAGFLLTRRIL